MVEWTDTLRPFFYIFAGASVYFLLAKLVFKSWIKAGLFTSLALLLFFSYGHYFDALYPQRIPIIKVRFDHNFYKWFSLLLSILVGWRLWKLKSEPLKLNQLSNGIALLLLIMPAFKIAQHYINNEKSTELTNKSTTSVSTTQPSVYYFIMDAYGRNDILKDLYDYDNSEFTNFLKEKGFYVAEKSFANYNKTVLSIPSSLNMTYLDSLSEALGEKSEDQGPLLQMIDHNKAVNILKSKGYTSVAFDSPILPYLFMKSADEFMETPDTYINQFESELFNTSILKAFKFIKRKKAVDEYDYHRKKILNAFDKSIEVSKRKGPHYVHGHILSPHQPFVFNSKGESVDPKHYYTCWMPIEDGRNPEEYRIEYIEQLRYINTKLKETITAILENSDTPPIIVIQGDHGPCSELTNTKTIEGNNFHERMPILNAYYFPDGNYEKLYVDISPVNSYRVILSQYFGEHYELLPDSSYYSTWKHHYDFVNVTESAR